MSLITIIIIIFWPSTISRKDFVLCCTQDFFYIAQTKQTNNMERFYLTPKDISLSFLFRLVVAELKGHRNKVFATLNECLYVLESSLCAHSNQDRELSSLELRLLRRGRSRSKCLFLF